MPEAPKNAESYEFDGRCTQVQQTPTKAQQEHNNEFEA
jgi:hypothetical protein